MSKIECRLFGVPQIVKDGQPIFFPYAKISALLYYLLVAKVVSRDEIAGLLWPNENDETAKRNLRNAIYQAKKTVGEDIITSPKKSILVLNEALEIDVDAERFLQQPQKYLHLYVGEFLQGVFLKDSDPFEHWLVKMRGFYKEKFSSECAVKIEEGLRLRAYDQVEGLIGHLMSIDEYDERSSRLLMRFYQETGRNGKAIETYYELAKVLRQELGVAPDQTTKDLYERSLEEMHVNTSQRRSGEDVFFYGRYELIASLEKVLKDFREGREDCQSILIRGEPGSGKSTIKQRILERVKDECWVFDVQGLPSEQDLSLRAWRSIAKDVSQIIRSNNLIAPELWDELMGRVFPDFQSHLPANDFFLPARPVSRTAMAHVMTQALKTLAQRRQVLLVIDDLQWLDGDSLRLLASVLLESSRKEVLLVATCSPERSRALDSMLAALRKEELLFTVDLEPLTMEACHRLMEKMLPELELRGDLLEKIYGETEGTPFYLNEYIGMLRQGEGLQETNGRIREFIEGQLINLSQDALDTAQALSYFYDGASVELLAQVMGKDPAVLLPPLKGLGDRGIVRENSEGMLSFSHVKLREYLYGQQPDFRRRLVHRKIAVLLEKELERTPGDARCYPQLAYHFSAAGNQLKSMKYRIASLNRHLNFCHEIFPIVSAEEEVESDFTHYMSREKIERLFRNLESDIQSFRASEPKTEELELLELEFFYMRGRYSILEGGYDSGIRDISEVIKLAQRLGKTDYIFEGYRQLICYSVQVDDAKKMAQYIEPALDLAVRCNNHKEVGVLLRLKGLYNMLIGNNLLAEKLLNESINTLSITEGAAKNYAVNIAAAYDYLGEIRLAQQEYGPALELLDQAISICPNNALTSLAVFYINGGKAAYFLQDRRLAKAYFEKAYSLYSQQDAFWLRPTMEAYLSLILVEEGRLEEALDHLEQARQIMWQMKYPSDLGTVFFAQTLIRILADQDDHVRQVFGKFLSEAPERYCQLAKKHLNPNMDQYGLKYLDEMVKKAKGFT